MEQSFNSRTREGCDFQLHSLKRFNIIVSIHAPGRGATFRVGTLYVLLSSFNSRTREGCDVAGGGRGAQTQGFNSRTREGCDSLITSCLGNTSRFNSRTREGCDSVVVVVLLHTSVVSIHAPGRGATGLNQGLPDYESVVSIHAPGRGATRMTTQSLQLNICFNSRTREGCDSTKAPDLIRTAGFQFTHPGGVRLDREHTWRAGGQVSIHAPGRGATAHYLCVRSSKRCFNSRTREGCDIEEGMKPAPAASFNSRTREGCDWRLRPKTA